jgi:hypothetical protein
MSIADKTKNKFLVVEHLIKSKVPVETVLDATVDNISANGFILDDKVIPVDGETLVALGEYIQTLNTPLLFPGLRGTRQKTENFLMSFSHYLKKSGRTLRDLGLTTGRTQKPKVKLENLVDIKQYLLDKFKDAPLQDMAAPPRSSNGKFSKKS